MLASVNAPATPAPLNIVCFAHNNLQTISQQTQAECLSADLIIALGDVNLDALAEILPDNKPALAVLGPNDPREVPLPFRALHASGFAFRGWRIAGFSGAPKVRQETPGIYVSEAEAQTLFASLPPCDLLVTHAPPAGLYESGLGPDQGFEALRRYMEEKPPIYHFYAHPQGEAAEEVGESLSVGVYHYLKPPPLHFL